MHDPKNSKALLTRVDAAAALTLAGFPISPRTLATKVTRGGGPPYSLFCGRALYRLDDILQWAEAALSAPRCSSSETDASSMKRILPDGVNGASVPRSNREATSSSMGTRK